MTHPHSTSHPASATQGASTAWPASTLQAFLEGAFPGATVAIRDDTALHKNHNVDVGHFGGHYRVQMVWAGFAGVTILKRHKLVMDALKPVWKEKHIHALTLKLRAPSDIRR